MTLLEDSDDEEMENTVHVSDSDSLSDELDQEEQRNTDGKLTFRDKYFHLISESQTSFQLLNVTLL